MINQGLNSQLVSVEFYVHSNVIIGELSCPADCRLLDLLNGSGIHERSSKGEFVEFVNAFDSNKGLLYQDKPKEYIRKAAIQLVAISDGNLGRGAGATSKRNLFPFVLKTPVSVSLQLETYTLIGTMHLDQGQTARDILNEDVQFLPLTEVTIAQEYHLYGTRPFVAVNKRHIISSRQEKMGPVSGEYYDLTSAR